MPPAASPAEKIHARVEKSKAALGNQYQLRFLDACKNPQAAPPQKNCRITSTLLL
jgi:hypothetical protein